MPDISMCANKLCPSRHTCFRFMGRPNLPVQSYMRFEPDETGKCDDYIETRSKSQMKRVDTIVGDKLGMDGLGGSSVRVKK